MDAVKFFKELRRICKFYRDEEQGYCSDNCPAHNLCCFSLDKLDDEAEELIASVEAWSNAPSSKTHQDVFMERWPNAQVDNQGILFIYPCDVDKTMRRKDGPCYKGCEECRAEFWAQEVE